jgi:membrane protease YdiL (CAAX protease family)
MVRAAQKQPLLAYFLLCILLMVPFWILGALTGIALLPGLPIAALGVVCPVTAALILVYRAQKRAGVVALLKRSFDFNRIRDRRWYLALLLIMPAVMALSYGALRLAGVAVPPPRITLTGALALVAFGFLGALGEELGWSGYATDPLQARWGALKASLLLGGFWAIFHYVGLAQAHRDLAWMAWWTLYTVGNRTIMVWLFNHAGKSVAAMALYHMTINVTWQLFPVSGSYFDPRVTGLIVAGVASLLVGISVLKGTDQKDSEAAKGLRI